jgi:hypothetical protein
MHVPPLQTTNHRNDFRFTAFSIRNVIGTIFLKINCRHCVMSYDFSVQNMTGLKTLLMSIFMLSKTHQSSFKAFERKLL